MIKTRLPVVLCPVCGHTLDAASSVTNPDARPAPGDWMICIECTCVMEFDATLRPVPVSAARKAAALVDDPDLRRTLAALYAMHAAVGRPGNRGRPN